MIKQKKAWVRIVEAFIAIMLVMGVLIFLYTKAVPSTGKVNAIYDLEKSILDEIAEKKELRVAVLQDAPNIELIKNYVRNRVPLVFGFDVKICEPEKICNLDFYEKEVYTKERIVSAILEKYAPKKLKLFVWRK